MEPMASIPEDSWSIMCFRRVCFVAAVVGGIDGFEIYSVEEAEEVTGLLALGSLYSKINFSHRD